MWRYFGRCDGRGKIYEIYRWPANGQPLNHQLLENVQVLLADGTWRPNQRELLFGEMCKGGFDEKGDEITEEQARTISRAWSEGVWPGVK